MRPISAVCSADLGPLVVIGLQDAATGVELPPKYKFLPDGCEDPNRHFPFAFFVDGARLSSLFLLRCRLRPSLTVASFACVACVAAGERLVHAYLNNIAVSRLAACSADWPFHCALSDRSERSMTD